MPWRRAPRGWVSGLALALAAALSHAQTAVQTEERRNFFGDPFVQATRRMEGCPQPLGPMLTAEQARAQAHGRVERGTTCHRQGRCRLPNAYLYDQDIIARAQRFIQMDERFADSSVWLVGQRRWVFLVGCVPSAELAAELEREVRLIDDVEAVVNELMVGTRGRPPYETARPWAPPP